MMESDRARRRARLVTLNLLAWLFVTVVVVLVAVPVLDRGAAKRLAAAYTPLGAPQETAMDFFQEPPYAVALAVCGFMIVRLRRRPERQPFWVVLAALVAWLLWRELPYDERILGANTFSWAKYLGDAAVPLWAKVAFGGGSIVFTGAVLLYALRHVRALAASAREKVRSVSGWLLAAAGLALAGAQMVDKHRTTDACLGTNLSAWDLKDYLEESLEVVGPVLLVMALVLAILEEPVGAPEASDRLRVPAP